MSKGSSRRPAAVSEAFVRAEYERIFSKKPIDRRAFDAWALAQFERKFLEGQEPPSESGYTPLDRSALLKDWHAFEHHEKFCGCRSWPCAGRHARNGERRADVE